MFSFLSNWLTPKETAVSVQINNLKTVIMSQLAQIEARIAAVNETLAKVAGEITNEITTLREALANVELPPAAAAALEQLEAQAQALDAIIPDAAPVENTPAPEEGVTDTSTESPEA